MTENKINNRKLSKPLRKFVQKKLTFNGREISPSKEQKVRGVYDERILLDHEQVKTNDAIKNTDEVIDDYFFIAPMDLPALKNVTHNKIDCQDVLKDGSKNDAVMAPNKKIKIHLMQNKDIKSQSKSKLVQKKLIFIGNEHSKSSIHQAGSSFYNETTWHAPHVQEMDIDPTDSVAIRCTSQHYAFRSITAENLSLKYDRIFSIHMADRILVALEDQVQYFSGDLLKVNVFGKWHNIPRKQACYGDSGLSYNFSGNCFPAQPWSDCSIVNRLKTIAEGICKTKFNFVLVNRYKDGHDHMGEHRDDEKDLVRGAPIASMSFGEHRDFIFKHKGARGKNAPRKISPLTLNLEHGSILIMESPTNQYWYHSLPTRAKAKGVRVNLTFRCMVTNK